MNSRLPNEFDGLPGRKPKVRLVTFADYIYYPLSRQIERNGETKSLNIKQAAILSYLIENQDKECSKQSIINHVWNNPKTEKEPSFHQYLTQLRQALGDKGKPHKIIVKPAMGVYALEPEAAIQYEPTLQEIKEKEIQQKKSKLLKLSNGIIAAISGILIISTTWILQAQDEAAYKAVNYQAVTMRNGQIKRSAATPDASIIAFSYNSTGSPDWSLTAHRVGTEEYRTLVRDSYPVRNAEPSFSPSGNKIAWVKTNHSDFCKVMVADFNAAEMSISNEKSVVDCSVAYFARTPQWKNDNMLLVAMSLSKYKPKAVVQVDLLAGTIIPLTLLTVGNGAYGLAFNQELNILAYIAQLDSDKNDVELRIYDFNDKTDVSIRNYPYFPHSIAWIAGNKILSGGDDGFEVVSLSGAASPIHSESIDLEHYPFSMGQNKVGVVQGDIISRNISIIDLVNQQVDNSLSSTRIDYRAAIAKQSKEIVFVSTRKGKRQIFIDRDNQLSQFSQFDGDKSITDIAISSKAGFVAVNGFNNELIILGNSGELIYRKRYPSITGMSFSPDEQKLVFGVLTAAEHTIYQISLDSFVEEKLISGFMPKFSANGELYFFRLNKGATRPVLHKMNLMGEIEEFFEPKLYLENSNSFEVINDELYYVVSHGTDKTLVKQSLLDKQVTPVTRITSREFSLAQDLSKVVTTEEGVVQNNLASFDVVKGEFVVQE